MDTIEHPLFERQLEIEQDMRTAGIKRYRDQVERSNSSGQASNTKTGTRLVVNAHELMVDAMKAFMAEAESGKAGRKHTAVVFFKKLDVDTMANIAARCCLDSIMLHPSLTKLSMTIAGQIENEVNSRIFDDEMPKAHKKFLEKAKTESLDRRRWDHLLFPARLLGVTLEEWEPKDKLLVGMKLVELFTQATGLFDVKLMRGKADESQYVVEPTPTTLAWIEEESNRLETMFPITMPMIVPPKPWTDPENGGYWSIQSRSFTLVKTGNRAYLEELKSRDMATVYRAVNAIQDTPWAVNVEVLSVMDNLFASGSGIAAIPSADNMPLPQRPSWLPTEGKMDRSEMTPEQLEEFINWKADAHRIYTHNNKTVSKRAQFLRTIAVANKFKDEDAIYFPHQLDWRGRVYPMPLYLQPQGSDVQRGLLRFADGLPLADQIDADWLAIHGAGTWGFDKVDLEERIQWVTENQEKIVAVANDPYDNQWWVDADKPWQFLAFCFEWAGFVREGFGFVSYLSVQMDGTCNGLQNFSAMLLDEIGGAAVNLVPSVKPQDIYRQVAELVIKRIEADLFNPDADKRILAQGWHGNVDRTTVKRPVMTLAYGAKRFGFVNQVEEDTLKPWRTEDPTGYPFVLMGDDGRPFDYGYKAAMYMGGLIWECVGQVVIAARAAMDWLQNAAQIVSKQNLPINWITPTGFLVQQAYKVPQMKNIATTFNKTRIRIKFVDAAKKAKIDNRRQAAGISPNWVHSLDASHLMRTVERAAEAGVTAFSMIHDSYGTHAANTGALALFLREEFVRMYAEVDVLQKFKQDLEQQSMEVLPGLPAKGKLDLNQVLESSFFFA